MSRSLSRQKIMQFLYQAETLNETNLKIEEYDLQEFSDEEKEYIKRVFFKTIENKKLIDEYISKFSIDWDLERIALVDKSILRLAISELIFEENIPTAVIINEAVRMAKKYSTEISHQFINGILGSFIKEFKRLKE